MSPRSTRRRHAPPAMTATPSRTCRATRTCPRRRRHSRRHRLRCTRCRYRIPRRCCYSRPNRPWRRPCWRGWSAGGPCTRATTAPRFGRRVCPAHHRVRVAAVLRQRVDRQHRELRLFVRVVGEVQVHHLLDNQIRGRRGHHHVAEQPGHVDPERHVRNHFLHHFPLLLHVPLRVHAAQQLPELVHLALLLLHEVAPRAPGCGRAAAAASRSHCWDGHARPLTGASVPNKALQPPKTQR